MFKDLNLPNKLTMIRIFLVPVFIILLALASIEGLKFMALIALGVYVIASITDYVDGKIARSKNLITDFGKVMDPLADKILVAAGFVMLTYLKIVPGWISAIVIARDFFVDGMRMLAIMKNVVIPAGLVGKIKTFFEMMTIILALISYFISSTPEFLAFIDNGFSMEIAELLLNAFFSVYLVGVVISTIVSLVVYIIDFNRILKEKEESEMAQSTNE